MYALDKSPSWLTLILAILLFNRCAIVRTPNGGDKDIVPPSLVNQYPNNGSTNFNGSELNLVFNEEITTKDANKQLLISPYYNGRPEFVIKRNRVQLKLDQKLIPNTTYSFNFRKGLVDITEGNPAPNPKIIFSTGAKIDSGSVSIHATDAFTSKPVLNHLVALYTATDTINIYKHKPNYFGYTDSSGNATISFLPKNKLKLFVYNDLNDDLLYNDKAERLGWNDTIINPIANKTYNLIVGPQDSKPPVILSNNSFNYVSELKYNEGITNVKLLVSSRILNIIHRENSTLFTSKLKDSCQIQISIADSSGNTKLDTVTLNFNNTKKQSPYNTERLYNIPKTEIIQNEKFAILIKDSSVKVNTSAWIITTDTIPKTVKWIKSKDSLYTYLPKGKNHKLIISKNSITDIFDSTNRKSDTISLTTKIINENNVGSISIKVNFPKSNQLLQLYKDNRLVLEAVPKYENTFINLEPGTYDIKLLTDQNGNKRWDTANFKQNIQAEPIKSLPNPVLLKANWEIDDITF